MFCGCVFLDFSLQSGNIQKMFLGEVFKHHVCLIDLSDFSFDAIVVARLHLQKQ